jgi:curved DNA-binding protein CbpA
LRERATEEEIKARYKVLAKRWHPDKQKDPAKKLEAQEIFIEIQQAYEKIKTKRAHWNK